MMQHRILCPPAQWMDSISPMDAQAECTPLLPYLKGTVLEVFCRSGRLGAYLMAQGVDWSGMDPDAHILEHAFLRGMFAVSCGLYPKEASYDTIFGAFGALSCISSEDMASFVHHVAKGLKKGGSALFELWYEPGTQDLAPMTDSHDGTEKLVRVCVPQREGNKVCFSMEWMIAQANRTPFYLVHTEYRFLHCSQNLCSLFAEYFSDVSLVELGGRRWLFARQS